MTAQQAYRGGSGHDEIKEAYVYTYDRNSNIKSERIVSDYDRDSSGEGRDITRTYTYDELGRLTETREKKGSDETAEAEVTTYTYDKAGNRLTETKDGRTASFSYNALDQLTESKSTEESRIYSYDRNGNQTSEITREGDAEKGRRSYAYDEADRLKNLTVKEEGRLILTQENSYNGEGQRISKAETKLAEDLNGETTETSKTDYFYQDGAVLYTKDADGNRSSMNLLGTSANVIATSRGTGNSENWYLYNKDIRESTTSIIGANGSAAATYKYDDFGNTKLTGGTGIDNEICYTGQIYDQSSGLYYYNARFYDSENARFLTQDTYRGDATQPDTLHLYAYCANNPINYVDPTGHVFTRTFNRMQCQNMYAQLVAIEWTWTAIEFVRGKLTSAYKLYSKLKRIKKHMKNVKKLEDQKKKIKALKSLLKRRKKTLAKKILSTGIGKVVEKIIKSPKRLYGKFKRGFQIGGWGYMRVIMSRKKIVKEKITKTKFKFYSVLDFRFYYSTKSIKNFRG